MKRFFLNFKLLLGKELRLNTRSWESLASILFFGALVILIFNFSFGFKGTTLTPYVPAFVWVTTLFGGMLRMTRSFDFENEGKVLEGLKTVEGISTPLFLSKILFNLLYILTLEIVAFLLVVLIFNVREVLPLFQALWFPFLLGTLGFCFLGTTFSGVLLGHRGRDLLLPLMVYPVMTPLIIGVIQSIQFTSMGSVDGLQDVWIRVLVAFDVIFITACVMAFDFLLDN